MTLFVAPEPLAGAPVARSGVIVMEDWLAARWPDCCQPARCRCDCGCRAHSHMRRCGDCSRAMHHAPRPVLVPLTARTAAAWHEWPPAAPAEPVDHLAHLRRFMRDRPEPVQ